MSATPQPKETIFGYPADDVLKVLSIGWDALKPVLYGGIALFLILNYLSLYSMPPSELFPDGYTAIIWQRDDFPFFRSAEGDCILMGEEEEGVCLLQSLWQESQRIIVKLPYIDFAYSASLTEARNRMR